MKNIKFVNLQDIKNLLCAELLDTLVIVMLIKLL